MRKIIVAAAILAVLGLAADATVAFVGRNSARADVSSRTAMPIEQLTLNAGGLPTQSFDSF